MKITFLVGNGLDIALGLNTSYKSFYDWYCNQESEKSYINTFRKEIKDDIENDGENWSDFEKGLGKFTEIFTLEIVHLFLECYEDARNKLLEYLELELSKTDLTLSDEMLTIARKGIANYYQELKPKEKQAIERIYPVNIKDNCTVQFISFNYTNVLDVITNQLSNAPIKQWINASTQYVMRINPKVLHIHGKLDEYPIFGVNDESQIANKELLKDPIFRSTMIKSNSVDEVGQLWYEEAKNYISASNVICIYGMSLGITDSNWFTSIMRWLRADKNHFLIIYWYDKTPSNNISITLWAKHKAEVKRILDSYSGFTEPEIEDINERIFIIENTSKLFSFKLNKINQQNVLNAGIAL